MTIGKWISVKDRPINDGECVGMIRRRYPAFYWIGKYETPLDETDEPDYYILLPEPPKDDGL